MLAAVRWQTTPSAGSLKRAFFLRPSELRGEEGRKAAEAACADSEGELAFLVTLPSAPLFQDKPKSENYSLKLIKTLLQFQVKRKEPSTPANGKWAHPKLTEKLFPSQTIFKL